MDDLLVTSEKDSDISKFKKQMKHYFEMSNLGQLSSYLGIKVSQEGGMITLSQSNYAKSILSFAKMEECNLAQTPLEARMKFNQQEGPLVDSTIFRSLIGSLRYLTHTRSDLTYFVGFLSRFIERPTIEHLTALKRVLRYLRGTIGYGLVYLKGQSKARLVGYSDRDFAGDEQDTKSTSGQVFLLGDMLISWASQKQKTVDLSSCEAKYVAATAAACQGMWLNRLNSELSGIDETMVKLLVDNKLAIVLTKNLVQHSRTKHIDTRHHFIRQYVEDKKIQVDYVRTEDQLADILTKSLGRVKFLEMRERLGVVKVCMEELSQGGECCAVSALHDAFPSRALPWKKCTSASAEVRKRQKRYGNASSTRATHDGNTLFLCDLLPYIKGSYV